MIARPNKNMTVDTSNFHTGPMKLRGDYRERNGTNTYDRLHIHTTCSRVHLMKCRFQQQKANKQPVYLFILTISKIENWMNDSNPWDGDPWKLFISRNALQITRQNWILSRSEKCWATNLYSTHGRMEYPCVVPNWLMLILHLVNGSKWMIRKITKDAILWLIFVGSFNA